jgi:hypothetical protein
LAGDIDEHRRLLKFSRYHDAREGVMKARRLIESSAYDAEALRLITRAFDAAWGEIAHHFHGDDRAIEAARLRLAHAVLVVAREDSDDPERLKRDALQLMAMAYREIA